MKMKSRKISASILVLALIVIMTACSGQPSSTSTPSASPTASAGQNGEENKQLEEEGLPTENGKFSPEVTMTTARGVGPSMTFVDGESIEDNVHTRYVKENLGINIEYLWTTSTANDAFKTKLRLTLSANEPLPDVITVPTDIAHELIDSGKFQPVGDLFDKYAGETWKAAMNEVPHEWYPYIRDGERFGLPNLDYEKSNNNVMWIREDWLEKLNLDPPRTIEELENVMEAFKTGDPDGNSKHDTVPLVLALNTTAHSWVNTGWLYGAFGALPEIWMKDSSGELVYGSVQPEIKEALVKIQEWIKAGYVHREAGLHDETKAYQLFTSGTSGIMVGPTWAHAWPLQEVEALVPGAKVRAFHLPTGPDGKSGQLSGSTHYMVTLINKDMKHPEIYFNYMNHFYDNFSNPPEGGVFEFGLAEGYDWVMKDGVPTNDPAAIEEVTGHKPIGVSNYFISEPSPRIPSLQIETVARLHAGEEPKTPFDRLMMSRIDPIGGKAVQIVLEQAEFAYNNQFVGNPTPTMISKRELLTKLEEDTFSKIQYDRESQDYFDTFVEMWEKQGGVDITKEVNEWYQSLQN